VLGVVARTPVSPDRGGGCIHELTQALQIVRSCRELLAHANDPTARNAAGLRGPLRDLQIADGLIGRALAALVEWTRPEDEPLP
jgi:hypothetical protein